MIDYNEVRDDIAAFADNEDAVQIDKGYVLFQRDRTAFECQLVEIGGVLQVKFEGNVMTYRRFLGE